MIDRIDDDDEVLRRHLLVVATSRYQAPYWPDLPGVDSEVDELRRWLCDDALEDRRFTPLYPELADSPSKEDVRAAFEEKVLGWNESDAAVVFVTGHGHTVHNTHWLALRDTDGPTDVQIRSADILRWLANTRIQHLLVIFDLCNAGATAYDSLRLETPFPQNWIVLASTGIEQKAQTGALTAAIREFLHDLSEPEGGRFDHSKYLRIGDFLSEVQAKLDRSRQTLSYVRPELPMLNQYTPCLPNPRWRPRSISAVQRPRRDLAIRPDDLSAHWDPKARGVSETGESGWLFTGRRALMRRLVNFTVGDSGTVLVTGSAGCGKSAALARLVTLSDPEFVKRYDAQVSRIDPELRPAIGAVDVAVRATGKLPHEVFQQICAAFGIRSTAKQLGVQNLDKLRQAWWTYLDDRLDPVTIVVDALDEAAYPNSLLVDVLSRLERPGGAGGRVRLLVGVRSLSDQDGAHKHVRTALADRAEDLLSADRLRVDRAPFWVPSDLAAYATEILSDSEDSPYFGDRVAAERVARVVGSKAGTSYLIAQLAANSLRHREHKVKLSDPTWLAALDAGVVGVFRDDLHANTATAADRERVVHLLRAVAFAYGRGLPWHRVWPLVANVVRSDTSAEYGDADIAWLLNSRLGGYLITDQEDETTVYRLFHDSLRSTLRERWRELLDAGNATTSSESVDSETTGGLELGEKADSVHATERRIACALSGLTAIRQAGGLTPPMYVRRHLVEHAHAGGVLDPDTIPIAFLPFTDVSRLREVVTRAGVTTDPLLNPEFLALVPVIRKVGHLWDWDRPGSNAAALNLWGSMSGVSIRLQFGGSWDVAWSTRSTDRSEIIGRHPGPTSAVCTARLTSGRFVAVTGGSDGIIRTCDLLTGSAVGEPLTGHRDWVGALISRRLHGERVVVISGSDDHTVRLWDLETGMPIGGPLVGHTQAVRAVATTDLPDGRPVAVSGGHDRTVRVWNLADGTEIGPPLTGHDDTVTAVATATRSDGTVLALSASADGTVRIWDLTNHRASGPPLRGHSGAVLAISVAQLPGNEIVAVSGGVDRTLCVWDLAAHKLHGEPLVGHKGAISALAVATLPDHRVIAVTGGNGKSVRLWDLAYGVEIGRPLTGHTDRVHSIATTPLPGRAVVAVTGSDDRTVRLWDLVHDATATQASAPQADTVYAAASVITAAGRSAIVAGGADHTVRVWDFDTGSPIATPMTGHTGIVGAVATARLPDGRIIVVSGGADRAIRIWDLSTGRAIGKPRVEHNSMISGMATAALSDGKLVAVTGSWDYSARIWDLTTGQPLGEPLIHEGPVIALATARLIDGRTVAVTGCYDDGDLRMWDLDSGRLIARLNTGHTNSILGIAVSVFPDGRTVAVTASADRTVRTFDIFEQTAVGAPLIGHAGPVRAVATTHLADGRRLAVSGSDDRTVRVWDLPAGRPTGDILPTPSEVHALAVAPRRGSRIAICGEQFRSAVDILAGA
ncbi:hypothetical protein [Nocardia xishanensis]